MSSREIIYEFARVANLEGWWIWTLLIVGLAAAMAAVIKFYRRDAQELSKPIRWSLVGLRVVTVLALVFFFLELQRRTQRLVTRPSEIAVLVDTSQSMSLPADSRTGSGSRTERAREILSDTELVDQFSQAHRVSLYAVGERSEPRLIQRREEIAAADPEPADSDRWEVSPWGLAGALLIAIGVVAALVALLAGATGNASKAGWWVLAAAVTLVAGIISLGIIYATRTDQSLAQILGLEPAAAAGVTSEPVEPPQSEGGDQPRGKLDWEQTLAAAAPQSRIGDAIRSTLAAHDPATLAGIVVMTDGQNNGGVELGNAISAARRVEVAVYPVGLGSSDAPVNVRVVDLDAPRRVYPGDDFVVNAILQGSGPAPLDIEVQLLDELDQSQAATGNEQAAVPLPAEIVDSKRVTVSNDGTLTGIRFELEPQSVGRRRLAVRLVAPPQDSNELDDVRDARYEVVARKLRVLTIAGGPTREYRFVRNLLYRDNSIELHTWLQTGQPGMSQDADLLLTQFPSTPEELFQYDAIVMFDPDWLALGGTDLEMLDRWLSEQAGGLVLIGGPVYHPQWSRQRTDPRVTQIAGFFPINVSTRSPLLTGGRQGGDSPWPLKFTDEARRAEFLWIADAPAESFQVWDEFGGVYDFVDAKSAKPGAKVYAYFSDPTTEISGALPVYLASQFYGAGRVYFQGSGEMWRLRGESDAYFDSYYTKLIRWVGSGRLLRDSNRGLLLVDSSRAGVGDTITVRAVLTDDQFEPLDVPEVKANLLAPGGRIAELRLLPQAGQARAGTYGARFVVREAGSYEIRLPLGDALSEQLLRQTVQVRLPTVELERPRRNDVDLQTLADTTGGKYLPVQAETDSQQISATLLAAVQPQPQTTVLPGTPDVDFMRRRNAVLMCLIATALTMEWIVRRLHRLA